MLKSQISFSLVLILLAVWALHNYDMNSQCYELVPIGAPLNQNALLNKCTGETWVLVKDEIIFTNFDENDEEIEEKVKTLVWTGIEYGGGVLSMGSPGKD